MLINKGIESNFLDTIKQKANMLPKNHKDKITVFDNKYLFYFLKDKTNYILAVKQLDSNNIIKIRYSLDGVMINKITDEISNGSIIRKSGNKEITIIDNEIMQSKQNIPLKPIEKIKYESLFIENPNIGVIDCETYLNLNDVNKIYCLGFMTNLNDKPIIYYVDNTTLDSDKIVLDMINELLRPKYNNITFYCHNLGGYDIVFILKVLNNYNDINADQYKISCVLRKDKVIKVTISKSYNKITHQFTIFDSYCMLNDSLYNLSNKFEVETIKTKFPYSFAKEKNLYYCLLYTSPSPRDRTRSRMPSSA